MTHPFEKNSASCAYSTDYEYATYLEEARTKPTMKQKVRFIFKARDQGATVSAVPPTKPKLHVKG